MPTVPRKEIQFTNGIERRRRAWLVVRDIWTVLMASFMLLHETISTTTPDETIIAAALVMLGAPVVFRLDAWRREK